MIYILLRFIKVGFTHIFSHDFLVQVKRGSAYDAIKSDES